jgi:hypothetical protein
MTSKSWVVALAASAFGWHCSPVANPIVEVALGSGIDAAGGTGGAPDSDAAGSDARVEGDAFVDRGPPSQICGDGEKQGDEYCDDFRNPTKGFGCNDDCSGLMPAVCMDGEVTSPEVCDGPEAYCANNCTKIVGSCGDGTTQSNENCDSKGESATCNIDCTFVRCGDRIVNRAAKEVCDDALNDGQPGSCTADCTDFVSKATEAMSPSCKDLLAAKRAAGQTLRSGFYWLKAKDGTAFVALCDTVSEGGGWTLIMRAIDSNFDYYDPLWGNATLENETSYDVVPKTRSKYRAFAEVPFTEIRTSELVDPRVGYAATVPAQTSAQAFFAFDSGEGVPVTIDMGPDALEEYFNARAVFDDRQWGCNQFIHVGLNQHKLLQVKDTDSKSLGAGTNEHCDWDGGARFGQRVNSCHYSVPNRECSGNHVGQGWGNFKNNPLPLKAKPISQLLWVR